MSDSEWIEVRLGEVIEINKNSYSNHDNWDYINYLDTGNITENRIDKIQYLDTKANKIPSRAKRKVNANEIIYSTVRPNQKHYGIIKKPLKNMLVSTGFAVINGKDELADNSFLYWYLTQDHIVELLHSIGENSTSAYPSIKPSDIEKLDILLPPLPEQKAIAATLSALDDMIELNYQINKTLEEMAQAIFKSWFVDFEPFKDGEFQESELGMIPKGWGVVEFEKISTIQNGYAFKSSDYQDVGCRMIRTTNITSDGYVNNLDIKYLPQSFYESEKYKNYRFECFDTVLVMVGASIGKIGLITEHNLPSLQNQNMWKFRAINSEISSVYIHYMVRKINEFVSNWATGSARDFYRKESFQKAKCVLPPKNVMKEFKFLTDNLFFHLSSNIKENGLLVDIRDNLLPKLMSGEIRVPIEEAV